MGKGNFVATDGAVGGGGSGGGGFSPTIWAIEAAIINTVADGDDGAFVSMGVTFNPKKEYILGWRDGVAGSLSTPQGTLTLRQVIDGAPIDPQFINQAKLVSQGVPNIGWTDSAYGGAFLSFWSMKIAQGMIAITAPDGNFRFVEDDTAQTAMGINMETQDIVKRYNGTSNNVDNYFIVVGRQIVP